MKCELSEMRPESVFILSSLDVRTLAEFPRELDPCIAEALRDRRVTDAMTGNGHSAASLRDADVNTREAFAKAILNVVVPETERISTPTPIPGVVTPKPETGLPPIPLTIPEMALKLPDTGIKGMNTIEFQELIPGIKLPAIPLLIPGLEKLPLLPGWTVRNREGRVVSEGARIPTLPPGIIGIKIPGELPPDTESRPSVMPERPPIGPGGDGRIRLGSEYPAPDGEHYPENNAPITTGSAFEQTVPTDMPTLDILDLGDKGGVEKKVSSEPLEDEPLEL